MIETVVPLLGALSVGTALGAAINGRYALTAERRRWRTEELNHLRNDIAQLSRARHWCVEETTVDEMLIRVAGRLEDLGHDSALLLDGLRDALIASRERSVMVETDGGPTWLHESDDGALAGLEVDRLLLRLQRTVG